MFDFDVYLDSDGVLADFSAYCLKHYGKLPEGLTEKGEKAKFWSWVTHHNNTVEPFFRSLPKMADADALVEFCRNNFRSVKVLTARGNTPTDGEEQKIGWYEEHFPGLECIVVRKSPDKAEYAHERSILIDDRNKSIDPWVEAGGIGVLHTSAKSTILTLKQIVKRLARMNNSKLIFTSSSYHWDHTRRTAIVGGRTSGTPHK